jgi:hypothetical protein
MVEVEVVADVQEELEMSLYSRLDVNLEKILLVEMKNYIEIEEKFFLFLLSRDIHLRGCRCWR